jgi:Deoxyribodipyrimidine photolyase
MNTLVDGDIAIDSWQWQMQAGITNPLQLAFRIYDPDKNLLEKDPQCAFVKRWLPEINQLETKAIQNYCLNHLRPPKMLNFQETKRTHGKIIADLRKQVRARLLQENSLATELALTQKTVVEKYYQNQQKRYLESQTQSLFDDFREGNE